MRRSRFLALCIAAALQASTPCERALRTILCVRSVATVQQQRFGCGRMTGSSGLVPVVPLVLFYSSTDL